MCILSFVKTIPISSQPKSGSWATRTAHLGLCVDSVSRAIVWEAPKGEGTGAGTDGGSSAPQNTLANKYETR